ncbi:MAG: hypothetical protein HY282_14735 [Nitrospirae bacterium]|nr:hypothetical protein [Candidatus Manganitrophaceae bacterium]
MLWYLPAGGYVESSAEGLWKMGESLEKEDPTLALDAYRSLRTALYATRSFYTPGKAWIDRSDQKIVLLMAQEPPYSDAEKKKTVEQRAAEALAIQKVPQKPDPGWSIVLEVGFWGWVAGVLLFIWVGFNVKRQVILKRGIFVGALILFFYTLWIIGMMKA